MAVPLVSRVEDNPAAPLLGAGPATAGAPRPAQDESTGEILDPKLVSKEKRAEMAFVDSKTYGKLFPGPRPGGSG